MSQSARVNVPVLLMTGAIALIFGSPAHAQVIRGCVQQSSLQVRIIGPAEVCRQTETLVTWTHPRIT